MSGEKGLAVQPPRTEPVGGMGTGTKILLAERGARITVLGIPIIETNFQITLKYKGVRTNRAYFDLTLRTQKHVPESILKRLLPASIDARAV
jgi:hypothetical protein